LSRDKKISDKEFFTILRENAGLYARTARAIRKQFDIGYTRQAVRQRAEKNIEELNDILDESFEVAEDGLHSIMRSKNERLRLEACKFQIKRRENVYDDKTPTSFEVTIIEGKNNK